MNYPVSRTKKKVFLNTQKLSAIPTWKIISIKTSLRERSILIKKRNENWLRSTGVGQKRFSSFTFADTENGFCKILDFRG